MNRGPVNRGPANRGPANRGPEPEQPTADPRAAAIAAAKSNGNSRAVQLPQPTERDPPLAVWRSHPLAVARSLAQITPPRPLEIRIHPPSLFLPEPAKPATRPVLPPAANHSPATAVDAPDFFRPAQPPSSAASTLAPGQPDAPPAGPANGERPAGERTIPVDRKRLSIESARPPTRAKFWRSIRTSVFPSTIPAPPQRRTSLSQAVPSTERQYIPAAVKPPTRLFP